jgi:pimeloyl-ACP methyl ester carboxylesterase
MNSTTTQIEPKGFELIGGIPCLIIWGENELIPLDSYAFVVMHNLPNARLEIIQDSGHAPFVEKTALVYERIHAFIT